MSEIAMQETAFQGGLAFFAEKGKVIDSVTVSDAAKPDTDPVDNWEQLKCITEVKFNSEKKDFGVKKCFDGVNFNETKIERIVRDEVMLKTSNMSEIVHRLQYGLTAAVNPGGAEVNAFESSDRKVYGWLKLQSHRPGLGSNVLSLDAWGYLELEEGADWKDGIAEPGLKFTIVKGSPLGTPIKFPA